jgi:hypothetical protein
LGDLGGPDAVPSGDLVSDVDMFPEFYGAHRVRNGTGLYHWLLRSEERAMSVIEVTTFRLRSGVDEAAFLEADRRVQTEFVPNHSGFLRRTTGRGDEGAWVVVTLWASDADADASASKAVDDAVVGRFMSLVDPTSVRVGRYGTLDL